MSATDSTTTIKDDLATEILRRRRKQMPRLTAALAAAVLIAIGIVGGVEIQKHWGSDSSGSSGSALASGNTSSLRAAFQSRFGGGGTGTRGATSRTGAGSGGVGGFGGFGAGASGTVTLIKGSDLYVTETTGNTVIVHTSAGSHVTKTVAGSVKTIHPGDVVSVNGTQAANGSWTASSIALTPSTTTSNG